MIPTDCKRLAEVDVPVAVVSTHVNESGSAHEMRRYRGRGKRSRRVNCALCSAASHAAGDQDKGRWRRRMRCAATSDEGTGVRLVPSPFGRGPG